MLPYTAFDITRVMTSDLAALANESAWPSSGAQDRPSRVRRIAVLLWRQLHQIK